MGFSVHTSNVWRNKFGTKVDSNKFLQMGFSSITWESLKSNFCSGQYFLRECSGQKSNTFDVELKEIKGVMPCIYLDYILFM